MIPIPSVIIAPDPLLLHFSQTDGIWFCEILSLVSWESGDLHGPATDPSLWLFEALAYVLPALPRGRRSIVQIPDARLAHKLTTQHYPSIVQEFPKAKELLREIERAMRARFVVYLPQYKSDYPRIWPEPKRGRKPRMWGGSNDLEGATRGY